MSFEEFMGEPSRAERLFRQIIFTFIFTSKYLLPPFTFVKDLCQYFFFIRLMDKDGDGFVTKAVRYQHLAFLPPKALYLRDPGKHGEGSISVKWETRGNARLVGNM